MTIDNDDLLNSIIASLGRINTISSDEMPNIDLYMDQLTSFMNERLKKTTRYPETDKILTKTMINNYAKNNLLPPPEKKKYTKDHIILLLFIYYYKNIMTINDIQTVLEPLKARFGTEGQELSLEDIYDVCYGLQKNELQPVIEDIKGKYERAQNTFEDIDVSEEEQERMKMFSFITLLAYDVYVKKLLIEKIIDNIVMEQEQAKEKEKADRKADKKNRNKE